MRTTMGLAAGARLGPYELVGAIGAGGMGEVYRARDTRLGRDIAIKVLPASFASDPERLRRFEQEARAVAALNHPNILAVYDIGTHDGAPFLVTELLEGETLRERLESGALPVRKAIEVAVQAAHGVAAAHEKGIIHRDLKPANIFLTSDGRVKILDFGLAKLTEKEAQAPGETQGATLTAGGATEPGVVLGTVGYMSPEQVRGKAADARSDIFALGTILYEMLSGRRAFEKDSSADTMAAILKEEPQELAEEGNRIPPALDRIVRHSMEKNPGERFQSARDLAFHLESLSGASGASATSLAATKMPSRRRLGLKAATVSAILVVTAAGAFFAGRWNNRVTGSTSAEYLQITFQPEAIFAGRFAPDGETVVYSAAPEGNVPELFVRRPDYPAPRPFGPPDTELLSISSTGELAILTGARYINNSLFTGTLARMDMGGGAPREVLDGVQGADWNPEGTALAIIREVNGKSRLEYPIGKVLYETAGYVSDLRFSPTGDRIAFFEHPVRYDDRGSVAVVDLKGRKTTLSEGYESLEGLAWSNDGKTIYFSGEATGEGNVNLLAVTLSGKLRDVLNGFEAIFVFDANRRGNLLASENSQAIVLMALAPGAKTERNLSWLASSYFPCLSEDGQWLLFTDTFSLSGGTNYTLLLRKTDGSPVARLGEGVAQGLSPDGKWALSVVPTTPMKLVLYPTGAGEPRQLEGGKIISYRSARFFPDGQSRLACGSEPDHSSRCYSQTLSGGPPKAVTPEGTLNGSISPDGKSILVQGAGGKYFVYPTDGGRAQPAAGLSPADSVVRWSEDGRSVLAYDPNQIPTQVERVDLTTGHRTLIREIAPADRSGVVRISGLSFAKGENAYAYSYNLGVSELAVIKGVK